MSLIFFNIFKRLIDIFVSIAIFLPVIIIIFIFCIIILLESRGNPIFIQKRIGKNGKKFNIIKLRGMYADSKKRYPELYDFSSNKDLNFYYHYEKDPRVTKVGKFIRQKSIDELPNIFNVLMGNMTLVGPRPEIPEVIQLYGKYKDKILSVKPGITCISKISGRDILTKEQTILKDIEYVNKMSIYLDLKILFITFLKSFCLRMYFNCIYEV